MNQYKTIQLPDFVFDKDFIKKAWTSNPTEFQLTTVEYRWFSVVSRLIVSYYHISDMDFFLTKTIDLLSNIKVIFSGTNRYVHWEEELNSMLLQLEDLSHLPRNVFDNQFLLELRSRYRHIVTAPPRSKSVIYIIIMNDGWAPMDLEQLCPSYY